MLRMGRSPKPEQSETERPSAGQPQQQTMVSQQPVQTYAQPEQAMPAQPVRAETATPSAPRAVTETETLARELKEGIMSGFLGSNTSLTGDAEFKGMLRIDGRFAGKIKSDKGTLIVSSGGRLDADVRVGTARVNGVVNGDITAAERIELGRSAQVRGNIQTPVLVIEQGAVFEGGCRMTTTRAEEVKPQAAATERPSTPRPATPLKPRAATPQPQSVQPPTNNSNAAGVTQTTTSVGSQATG